MATFHRKKQTVEAIQYEGGLVSAAKVIELFGLEEDCYKAKEKALYVEGTQVFQGSWVVREPFFGRDIFRFLSNEEFNAIFEPSTPVGLPERSIPRMSYPTAKPFEPVVVEPSIPDRSALQHRIEASEALTATPAQNEERTRQGLARLPTGDVKITDPSRL